MSRVIRWGLVAAGGLVGVVLLLHLLLAILNPLVPVIFALIFILTIFAVAIAKR